MGTPLRWVHACVTVTNVVVGCGDGNALVFDMYSSQCSQIRRMNSNYGPLTCLELSNDDSRLLILAGSRSNITMSSGLVGDPVASLSTNYSASYVRTLCYNPSGDDHWMVFGGSNGGYVHCWDLRTRKSLWNTKVNRYAVFSVQQLRNAAASDLVVGGADGVLRVVDHNTGEVISRIVLDTGYCALPSSTSSTTRAPVQRLIRGRRLSADAVVDDDIRPPPITSLAVGMKKVITTHDTDYVRTWKFD
uniref:F-box/WD-40 repeat-containing protein At3g52030-like n=1 Tax=Fragaria vesca subsp. vesca TaxID=101020 RepID=UPI0005C7FAA0|nr:PREDICTED: F-box/WD-40 repeat-containing protein At3g52030-like [Fragaria vesca subsp. vesca]